MQALSQLSYTPVSGNAPFKHILFSTLNTNGQLNGRLHLQTLAEWTGLEPATPGVTGRYSNQLNYHSAVG
jgi:hypothetical protein